MANGIDSIYDPSDVTRMLAELREQRIRAEEDRRKKIEGMTRVGTKAWEMWSGEQTAKTKELIGTGEYKLNPEKNWFTRSFSKAENRVVPKYSPTKAISLDKYKDLTGQGGSSPFKTKLFDIGADTSTKGTGVPGGIGTAISAADLVFNWEKKSDPEKYLGGARTALSAAAMIPSPASPWLAAGSAVLSLADMFID